MSPQSPDLLIISGGSEVAGLAVAEAARAAAIPYAVFSLVPHSVLRDAPGCTAWVDLSSSRGDWSRLRDGFLQALASLGRLSSSRLAILPTEDGSLRLLNECRDEVLAYGDFPRARALRMGGVDKAEVVELALRQGITGGLAASRVVDDPSEAGAAMDEFGEDTVFKPALKPLDMDLSGMGGHGAKVVTRYDVRESRNGVAERLRKAWPLSRRWIAQPRLCTGGGLERSVCAVRGRDVHACQVVEQAKYPRMGGTAYWVSTEPHSDLMPSAEKLMQALDIVGICELSYLPDAAGRSHLIEFNPRPWLQVGLVEHAGFHIIAETVAALRGESCTTAPPNLDACDWLQPERMGLALLAGQCSLREFGSMLPLVFRRSTMIGGYGSALPKARQRLAVRAIRRMLGFQP
jgi:predicted ATP-grasp superfamily ATP-dependent carboligase